MIVVKFKVSSVRSKWWNRVSVVRTEKQPLEREGGDERTAWARRIKYEAKQWRICSIHRRDVTWVVCWENHT